MFVPKLFANESMPEILNFIGKNPFGLLISNHEGRPFATHIPLEIGEKNGAFVLHGHISKANPQWKSWAENDEVLAIFSGTHGYISSSWYENMNVSTWNYIAVHLYGRLRVMADEELLAALKSLTRRYETGQADPLFVEKMPADYVAREMRGIVGFEIEPTRIEGKWKLSQNRKDVDYQRIIRELEQLGELEMAREMAVRRPA